MHEVSIIIILIYQKLGFVGPYNKKLICLCLNKKEWDKDQRRMLVLIPACNCVSDLLQRGKRWSVYVICEGLLEEK